MLTRIIASVDHFHSHYLWMQQLGSRALLWSCGCSVWLWTGILLLRINNSTRLPGYHNGRRAANGVLPSSPPQVSLMLSAPCKQPKVLPQPGPGHISSLTSPLPPMQALKASFLSDEGCGAVPRCQSRPSQIPPSPCRCCSLLVTGFTSAYPSALIPSS